MAPTSLQLPISTTSADGSTARRFASFFATDGALLPPDQPSVIGRAQIADWMRTQADLPYRLQPERVSQDVIQVRGDTAIVLTTLSWKRVPKVGSDPTAFENKCLDVVDGDGRCHWNHSTAPVDHGACGCLNHAHVESTSWKGLGRVACCRTDVVL